MKKLIYLSIILLLCPLSFMVNALEFSLNSNEDVVGELSYAYSHSGETLIDVGTRFDIGSLQIREANPSLPKAASLSMGTKILLPTQFILPDVERKGLVINLAEQRLYFFPEDSSRVITEPVGIGRKGKWKTPLGLTKVTKKVLDPPWHPTADVRTEAASKGTPIPWEFPAGLNNPLGRHVFRLGWASYLIHSTDQPENVGGLVSAGCIRMLPKGIENIFDYVFVGTQVRVINEPIKVGWKNNKLYFESHQPLSYAKKESDKVIGASVIIINERLIGDKSSWVSWSLVKESIMNKKGLPVVIGERS